MRINIFHDIVNAFWFQNAFGFSHQNCAPSKIMSAWRHCIHSMEIAQYFCIEKKLLQPVWWVGGLFRRRHRYRWRWRWKIPTCEIRDMSATKLGGNSCVSVLWTLSILLVYSSPSGKFIFTSWKVILMMPDVQIVWSEQDADVPFLHKIQQGF